MFDSFDVYSRPVPDRRHSSETLRLSRPPFSRNSSSTSVKSEPGWGSSSHGTDRNPGNASASPSSKSPSGLAKFFGKSKGDKPKEKPKEKPKKERRGRDPVVLTARHAAALRARKNATNKGTPNTPLMVGTQNSQHLTAQQQSMRRPHSGPPTVAPAQDKIDNMGMLTRIISGDEADEPDEWQRVRDEWKQSKIPDIGMLQLVERGAGSTPSSGTVTPEERDVDRTARSEFNLVELQAGGLSSVAEIPFDSQKYRPKPVRRHTPIGLRWRKDENGVWKR